MTWWHWVSGMAFVRFSQLSPCSCQMTAPSPNTTFSHCSKTGRKWGAGLSSCLSLFYQGKKSFLDTHQVSFFLSMSSVSHMSSFSWPWKQKVKSSISPLWWKEGSANKEKISETKIGIRTQESAGTRCPGQVTGLHLSSVCCDNCFSPPLVFWGPLPGDGLLMRKTGSVVPNYNCL